MRTLPILPLVLAVALVAAPIALARTAPPGAGPAHAGEGPSPEETKASVPELIEFHEVIARLWHEAWPKKDLAMLSSLLPEIGAGAAKVEKAALPGILRDRKPAWDAGVRNLGDIVADYQAAVRSKDLQKTLDAGERLHSQFEALVRITRPALKEVDAFHQVLYRLYHYELPAFSLPAIQASARKLQEEMTALDAAVLPERLQPKREAFEARRKDLGKSVGNLATLAAAGRDEMAIRDAVETVHSRYVSLDQVF